MTFADRVAAVYDALSQERGAFDFFALMEPEDTPGEWDLIMSAPWLQNTLEGSAIVSKAVTQQFAVGDWGGLEHFIIVPKTYPAISTLAADPRARTDGRPTLKQFEFADVPIRQAVVYKIPPAPPRRRRAAVARS